MVFKLFAKPIHIWLIILCTQHALKSKGAKQVIMKSSQTQANQSTLVQLSG